MNEHVNIFVDFLKGFGNALKNGFVSFVYSADGTTTAEFRCALGYVVIIASVGVVAFVARQIFKKRSSGI